MRFIYIILFSFAVSSLFAQEEDTTLVEVKLDSLPPVADPKYREDQFYASISYNLMQGKPPGYSQNRFSTGITVGFLRDMPVNKARNHAIAIGLGYGYNNIHHNLKVSERSGVPIYEIVSEGEFENNKLVQHFLELPIEFRWRNSDSISHKFWRVYAGFKVSYLFADKAEFDAAEGGVIKVKNDSALNNFVYGAYISAGWNTWNFYAYYGISPLYNSASTTNGNRVGLNSLNLGLMFYIL